VIDVGVRAGTHARGSVGAKFVVAGAAMLIAGSALILSACSAAARAPSASGEIALTTRGRVTQPGDGVTLIPATPVVRSVRVWDFEGAAGRAIQTDHYVIYTTDRSAQISERLPGMMESALQHYTSAITSLPKPTRPMETFVMSSRSQWLRLTLTRLGERARGVSNIARGGFAIGGSGYLFDIGPADTMSIASHEGWHQFTQSSFGEPLPVWAEEGIATFFEGHRFTKDGVVFSGWNNFERFDRLRAASDANQLLSLETLLTAAPDQILAMGNEAGVTYYAQIWALIHFLREGEGGKYRAGFERMVKDAAGGGLGNAVVSRLRASGALKSQDRGAMLVLARNMGPQVFRTYIDPDVARVGQEYRAFVKQAVAPGAKQRVSNGLSPIGFTKP